jgi:hypothetical protein
VGYVAAGGIDVMSLRAVVVVLALQALQGCTKTVYHAVLVPQRALDNGHGCFQRCQLAYAGQTNHFLMCVDACPETRVFNGKQCDEVKYDIASTHCTTARQQTFDGWSTALGISLAVLANILVFVALAIKNPPPSQSQ